jgi:hypothetical protein
MTRIKIKDLPRDMKISREEMRRVAGGTTLVSQLEEQKISSLSTLDAGKVFNDRLIEPGSYIDRGSDTPYDNALT